tara:strand:- start:104 stop:526 length:423 start_codon:yes stop_codon:yes gene_type:complete
MSECIKCRDRDAKAASSCEANFKELQKKYQKLLLVFAVLSGVLGKEIMDKTMSLFESVSPVVEVVSEAPKPKPAPNSYPYLKDTSLLFANVPPLLPNLNFTSSPNLDIFFEEEHSYVYVPEVGQAALLGSLPFLMKTRRR